MPHRQALVRSALAVLAAAACFGGARRDGGADVFEGVMNYLAVHFN